MTTTDDEIELQPNEYVKIVLKIHQSLVKMLLSVSKVGFTLIGLDHM